MASDLGGTAGIMFGPYVHRIDPVLADVAGIHLWWYGLGFALGFLQIHVFLRRGRAGLGLSLREVWSLSLFIVIGVLAGGRLVEVAFDEWPFYRQHPWLIPSYWLGGMATHGLMLGAAAGAGLFALVYKTPFRVLADALVIPGAFLMGVGRIGNFIEPSKPKRPRGQRRTNDPPSGAWRRQRWQDPNGDRRQRMVAMSG